MASNRGTMARRVFRKPQACQPPTGPCEPPAPGPEPPAINGHGEANQLGIVNHVVYDGPWSGFPNACFSVWISGYPMYGAFVPTSDPYTQGTIQKNAVGEELVFPPQPI